MASSSDPANVGYIIQENGFWYVAYKEKVKVPEVVVSAKGVVNGLSEEYNDGWDFGPDSYDPSNSASPPYSQTSGIQEAINSLPLQTNEDTANNTGTGPSGSIKLRNGVYTMANSLNIPTFSNVSLIGMNQSVNLGSLSILSTKDVGGVIIYFPASLTDSATNYPLFNAPIYTNSNIILNIKNITLYIDNPSSYVDATAININGMYNGILDTFFIYCYTNSSINYGNGNIQNGMSHNTTGSSYILYKNVRIANFAGPLLQTSLANSVIDGLTLMGSRGQNGAAWILKSIGTYNAFNNIHIYGVKDGINIVGLSSNYFTANLYNVLFENTDNPLLYSPTSPYPYPRPCFIAPKFYTQYANTSLSSFVGNISNGDYVEIQRPTYYIVQPTSPFQTFSPTLSTNPPATATAYQNTNPYDIRIYLPAYATTSGTAGSVAIALGSTSTPTAIGTKFVSGATSSNATDIIELVVPAGWWYSYTLTGVTLATASVFAV